MWKKLAWAAAASISVLIVCDTAQAHCRDARKTCEFAARCMNVNPAHSTIIHQGANNGSGQQIWGELNACAQVNNLKWEGGGKYRTFDDVSASCTNDDYLALGRVAVEVHDGKASDCNQLAP